MNHVQAMHVMPSEMWNCALLLAVASAIVIHTLRYNSQLVTGLAFLLGFSTVALTQDTVYALSAGVILALGIVAVSLRKCWYELEVFGILATFGNHFYWLYKLYPTGVAGHPFPQFLPSSIILVLYWLVFRVSYVVRRVESPRHERVSTIAALSNTLLLLVVMKFQSTHPELAFYALLVLGFLEFVAGQLPVTRKRRAAFTLLSILGAMLMFAAVPFKFSGNGIALLWMIGSEALLVAGVTQPERVFRRLGLVGGMLTGALLAFGSRGLIEQQLAAEHRLVSMGTQFLVCAAIFYANAHFVRSRWRAVFDEVEDQLAAWQSYLGGLMAFLGVWAILPGDGTAVGWTVLFVATIAGIRFIGAEQLSVQAWLFALAFVTRAALVNCHPYDLYPHYLQARLFTLPLLAVLSYLAAGWFRPTPTSARHCDRLP